MNKDLKATLITISMILGFIGFITLIIAFPILVLWLLVGIAGFCGINIAILLWDLVRTELDKIDREKREERLKKMMEDDQKLELYDFDLDENDKNQIQ
jgi:fatty acid desaturase